MPFIDADFIALNLPKGVNFAINGVTLSLSDVIANALGEAGSREGALATMYAMLESDQAQSETLDQYSITRWGMRGSDYWRLQAIGKSGLAAPSVIVPCRAEWPCGGIL